MVAERLSVESDEPEHGKGWRPSLVLEQRAGMELAELIASPVYYGLGVPRGDGRRVLLIPGFMGSDSYLSILSAWLRRTGYQPALSGIPINAGSLPRLLRQVERRCEVLADTQGRRITVIGHSLGGVFARVLAVSRPDIVEDVVTLGSPLVGNVRTAAHPMVRAMSEMLLLSNRDEEARAMAALASPLPESVRLVSIYTRQDAVVDYRACLDTDPRATCHEVYGTHVGLAWNAAVYRILGRALVA